MAFEAEFLDVMVDTVTWEKFTGKDEYSNPIYAAPVTIRCRVSPKSMQLLDANGNEVLSKANIYMAPGYDIGPQDLITQSNGKSDPVIQVARPPDGDGEHHVKVVV
jgi:hypothetical protein